MGLWVALSIPAAAWLSSLRRRKTVMILAGCLLLVDPGFNFYKESVDFLDRKTGTISVSLSGAMAWPDQNTGRDDVMLALDETSNYMPAYCLVRTVVGHSFQTDDYYQRCREVQLFFSGWDQDRRQSFLEEHRVSHILAGPDIQALTGMPGFKLGGWRPVYAKKGWQVLCRE
jgi:hypothetical protein